MHVASRDHISGSACITPQFIRQIENVRKEIRHMHKWLSLARNHRRPMLPLGHGVVPVFHAPPLPKDRIRVVCHVRSEKKYGTCTNGFRSPVTTAAQCCPWDTALSQCSTRLRFPKIVSA